MTYRDNTVVFSVHGEHNTYIQSDYKVGDGSFTVKEFCVSSGQDPDGHLSAKTYSINSGKLTFSLGRHGTEETADWFNSRVDADHNTFGHTAGKLNFAMIGTLDLTIINVKEYTKESYTFSDIALAQGHAGASNNWWFGSPEGRNASSSNHTIVCTGTDSSGNSRDFTFKRGGAAEPYGQDVNDIEIYMPKK